MATPVGSGSMDSTQTSPPVSNSTVSPAPPAIQNVHHHVSQKLSQATATIFHVAEAVAEDLLNNFLLMGLAPHNVPLAKFVKNRVIPLLHAGTALIKATRLILLL
jgi:hypothetical protein